jgi:hypothetical protein
LSKSEKTVLDQQTRWCKLPNVMPSVVTKDLKYTPPSGDIHDYYSLSTYYWPDYSRPFPHEPYIFRDGYQNPNNTNITDYINYRKMIDLVLVCSNAYMITGNTTFSDNLSKVLRAWFLDSETSMNPDLKFSQVKRGINGNVDIGSGLIDFFELWRVYEAVSVLNRSPSWNDSFDSALRKWFEKLLIYYRTTPQGLMASRTKNNHRVYYDLNVVAMANFLGKTEVMRQYMLDIIYEMGNQIMSDGTMPHEAGRASSYDYYVYCLEGFLVAAQFAKNMNYGTDIFLLEASSKGSIKKTLDLLIDYGVTKKQVMPGSNVDPIKPELLLPSLIIAGHNIDRIYLDIAKSITGFDAAYAYYTVSGNVKMS